jgi:hypothetical protein
MTPGAGQILTPGLLFEQTWKTLKPRHGAQKLPQLHQGVPQLH